MHVPVLGGSEKTSLSEQTTEIIEQFKKYRMKGS